MTTESPSGFSLLHSNDPLFESHLRDRTYNEGILADSREHCVGIAEETRKAPYCENDRSCLISTPPVSLAIPRTISDIQSALTYARENNQRVSIRSGGHNWFGVSLRGELLVDMRYFDTIDIFDTAKGLAKVGPAALGQKLNEQAAQHGYCFPSGHCVGVPLGGYLLGGGFGWFQHAFGSMAAELIKSMIIVTADGRVLHVNDTSDPDWMWLARGSASAFPAVVVCMTLQLQPLPPILKHQTTFLDLKYYEPLVNHLCELQCHGELSHKLELSVIPACTPSFLAERLLAQGATTIPDKVCVWNVYAMANSHDEFQELTSVLTKSLSIPFLYQSNFDNGTLSDWTNEIGDAYPSGLIWKARSVQIPTARYRLVDWQAISQVFDQMAIKDSLTHILTVIGPDTTYASGGGAYGKSLPGITVGVYVADFAASLADSNGDSQERSNDSSKLLNATILLLEDGKEKYNPLEHPVHSGNYTQCFPDTYSRIQELRNQFDPDSTFIDPFQIEPFP